MKNKAIAASDGRPQFQTCGPVCPLCHVVMGLAVRDKIVARGGTWHGPCFDRLPVPPEVIGCVDGVLESLADRLSNGPDKDQLAMLHARFSHDAANHHSPMGAARRNLLAIATKLFDMKDVPLELGSAGQAGVLIEALEAIKAIAAFHIPARHTALLSRRMSLAVGGGGMYYDRRESQSPHAA